MKSLWPAALVLAAAFGAADAAAAPPVPGARSFAAPGHAAEVGLSAGATTLRLRPLHATELMAGGDSVARPGRALVPTASGNRLQVDAAIEVPPLAAVITRELDEVWRYVPDPKRMAAEAPRMRVELRSSAGKRGELALEGQPDIGLPVGVHVMQSLRRGADGLAWYEGRVVLEIPVAAMRASGTYRGRIEISQESL